MSNENELLEPLATEAGQLAIARAINNLGSLENAVRAERAAATATQKADEARNSADDASDYATEARNWATKTDGYVDQETITIPPEQEGDEPTTETIDLYSARYYAALALDIYNNLQFDSVPTENSTNIVSSGAIYTALNGKADKSNTYTKTEVDTLISTAVSDLINSAPSALDTLEELANALGDDPNFATTIATQLGNKADKSDTYTKTEVDTALSNVQSTLTFDNVPTANSDNPVKSSGIKTALDGKQDTLTFDSTPTASSTNPVTSGGIYNALQNVNIDIDDEITEDSDNPVTSAAIWEALLNFTPSGEGGGAGNASGITQEVLYLGTWTSGSITLSKPITDFDFIAVYYTGINWGNDKEKTTVYLVYPTKSIMENVGYGLNYYGYSSDRCCLVVNSATLFTIDTVAGYYAYKIVGIKFSKNLSEQMYSNVLYENANGWSSGNITLNDSLENYDFIEIAFGESDYNTQRYSAMFSKTTLSGYIGSNKKVVIDGAGSPFFIFTIPSATQFNYSNRNSLIVYKIIGYKLAKGGYSGIVSDARMTVKSGHVITGQLVDDVYNANIVFDSPMPDKNYRIFMYRAYTNDANESGTVSYTDGQMWSNNKTENGFNIKCWKFPTGVGIDWIAIRPNSYTREGMVEDVLFSNANGVNSGTINLSGNISDYDLISLYLSQNNEVAQGRYSRVFDASTLSYLASNSYYFHVLGYDGRYIKFGFNSDNSLYVSSHDNADPPLKLHQVVGIKFGRYVSGVAVDTTVTQNSDAVVTSGAVYDALLNYTPSGGGSSITVDSTITQGGTNPVEGGAIYTALEDKADKSTTYTKTEVDTAVASKGDVTTDTNQNITGTKTFVGSKKVAFKLSAANDKLGFTLFGNTGTERGYLEFNPTNTIDGVAGLMTLGNYATSAAGLTQVGFRRYSNISGASGAYNLLMPMVADAKTPFSLTTSYQNFYLPLGFTDGTTTVRTAKSGVVDLSPLLQAVVNSITNANGVSY